MNYYLALENFRLVDRNEYYSVNQVLVLDEQYANGSRSLAAARRAGWIKAINEKEAKEQMKKVEASKIKADKNKTVKSEKKEAKQQDKKEQDKKNNESKKVVPNLTVDKLKPSDIADEVIDNKKIQDTVAKRRSERVAKEVDYINSTKKKTEDDNDTKDETKSSIKDAIDKKTKDKVKSRKAKTMKINKKKKKSNKKGK